MSMKKILFIILSLAGIISLSYLGFYYLTTGILIVTASKDQQITVQRIGDIKASPDTISGPYNKRLKSGSYSVQLNGNGVSSQKTVEIKNTKTTRLALPTTKKLQPEYVANIITSSFIYNNSRIIFIDDDTSTLQEISTTKPNPGFTSLGYFGDIFLSQWINGNGLFLTELDGAQKVATYKDGSLSLISANELPPGNITTGSISANGDIVLLLGKKVYRLNPGKSPSLIYTATESITGIMASQDSLVATRLSTVKNKNQTLIINIQTKKTAEITQKATEASWSPNGSLVAIRTEEQGILMDKENNIKKILPGTMRKPTWISNTKIAYIQDEDIWVYDAKEGLNIKVSSAPASSKINSLYYTGRDNTIHFSTINGNDSAIYKLNLSGRGISPALLSIQTILPLLQDIYLIEYRNIDIPTIVIRTRSDKGAQQNASDRASASNDLATYNFDLSQVKVIYEELDQN